jgi:oxygen-independent coproporphyrinogen III oxidase
LNLRLNEGIHFDQFKSRYKMDFEKSYKSIIDALLESKLVVVNEGRCYLTALGRDLSNQVFIKFLD